MGGGEVLRKGWLIKSPPLESGGIKNWRKRFFRLRSSKILEYYKSEDGDLKGVINLEDCKAVNSDLYHKKYKYVFGIETHDRVYYLVARTSEEMTGWVDNLCSICGFILRSSPTPPDQQSSKTLGNLTKSSKNEAIISPPVSTLPPNASAQLLSENFKTEENPSDVYSLATAAIYDVQGAEVPAGIPLSDALKAKGMTTPPINPMFSQSTQLPESAYFSPRSVDPTSLYAVPQKKKIPKQQSVESGLDQRVAPKHSPLCSTQSDAVLMRLSSEERAQQPDSSASVSTGVRGAETMSNGYMRPSVSTGVRGAETMSNGYMRPSNRPRPPNYDYIVGPPRPADGTTPPHRSSQGGDEGAHTYINVRELRNEIGQLEGAPQIDRSTKPLSPAPPIVNRGLKPGTKNPEPKDGEQHSNSPPDFPTRSGSLSTPPILDSSDLPKPTRRTMKYTQVQFESSGQLSILDDSEPKTSADINKRGPVPVPRGLNKTKRVNYSDIDLAATQAMAARSSSSVEKHVSLNEAEMAALSEKPYVNVARDGLPDDDTDPDYYTHMRDLPADSLLYAVMSKNKEDNEDLYQEPRETMAQ